MSQFDPIVLLTDAVEAVYTATSELLKVSSHWWELVPADPPDGHPDVEWSIPRVEVEPQLALVAIRKAGQLFDANTRDVRDKAPHYRDWVIKWIGGRLLIAEVREELSKPIEYVKQLVALSHTITHRLGDYSREITYGVAIAPWAEAEPIMLRFRDVIQSLRDFQPRVRHAREDRAATAASDAVWLRAEIEAVAVGVQEQARTRLFSKHDSPVGLNSEVINGLLGKQVIRLERRADNGFWADFVIVDHQDNARPELAWLVRHQIGRSELDPASWPNPSKVQRTIDHLRSWLTYTPNDHDPAENPQPPAGETELDRKGKIAYELIEKHGYQAHVHWNKQFPDNPVDSVSGYNAVKLRAKRYAKRKKIEPPTPPSRQ